MMLDWYFSPACAGAVSNIPNAAATRANPIEFLILINTSPFIA
jgi:hypothetical protein